MFRARYEGECAFCQQPIEEGDLMGLAAGVNADGVPVERAPACEECAEERGDETETDLGY